MVNRMMYLAQMTHHFEKGKKVLPPPPHPPQLSDDYIDVEVVDVFVVIDHNLVLCRNSVLPKLEKNSIVIMDKASYHMRITGEYKTYGRGGVVNPKIYLRGEAEMVNVS